MSDRLEELARLPAGWYDGQGLPVGPNAFEAIQPVLEAVQQGSLPEPYLFPTLTGQILAEWWSCPQHDEVWAYFGDNGPKGPTVMIWVLEPDSAEPILCQIEHCVALLQPMVAR